MKEARYRMDVLLTRSDTETFHNSREQMKLSIHQYLSFLINEDAKRLQAEAEQATIAKLFKAAHEWLKAGGFPEGEPLSFNFNHNINMQDDSDIGEIWAIAGDGQVTSAHLLHTIKSPTQEEYHMLERYAEGLNNL